MRPIASEDRYQKLLEVADAVEPLGRFRCVLALARECGRRINAIVNLRASDVLLSPQQIEIALDRRSDFLGSPLAARRSPLAKGSRQDGL